MGDSDVQALIAATLVANSFGGREASPSALVEKYHQVLKELAAKSERVHLTDDDMD
jgi:hypothetical protein